MWDFMTGQSVHPFPSWNHWIKYILFFWIGIFILQGFCKLLSALKIPEPKENIVSIASHLWMFAGIGAIVASYFTQTEWPIIILALLLLGFCIYFSVVGVIQVLLLKIKS